jgi:hypothetical protein
MSKNSDHVKRWRENTKDRIIESMGGGCCVCGYNITHRSLALHHINPMDKKYHWVQLEQLLENGILLLAN